MKKTEYEVGAKVSVVRDKCSMPGCLTALDDLYKDHSRCLLCYAAFCLAHHQEVELYGAGPYQITAMSIGPGPACPPYNGFALCKNCQADPRGMAYVQQLKNLAKAIKAAGDKWSRLWRIGYDRGNKKL